jgi:hypothetical protein
MIRLALRLTVAGGREAAVRLVTIAAAAALGVGLLVACLAGTHAVDAQNSRYAWLNTTATATATANAGPAAAADPLWWRLASDYFHGQTIGRVDVAATGARSPVPPGIPRLPGPGEFYASPALTALLGTTPADQLGDRFPGRQVGTVGPSALPAPNSLIVVIGHAPGELSRQAGAVQVTSIMTTSPSRCDDVCYVGIPAAGMDLILGVVAGALVFPLLIFIGTATRLAAARREQRFAAMRLVGATPRQVSVISAVESTLSALAGTAAGFGLFFLSRDALAGIAFTGAPFFPADLSLGPVDVLLVAVGVPAAAAVAARFALRRVRISPLGVSRRVTPRPPRAYRLIPLALGVAELAYFLVGRRPATSTGQVLVFLPGFLVIMAGLVIAGPWLTMVGSRVIARRTTRAATLIAARRLADNPQAGFRAVSGLVLALFVTSVTVGVIGTIAAIRYQPEDGTAASNLVEIFRPEPAPAGTDPVPAGLTAIPGVHGAAVVHLPPDTMVLPEEIRRGWRYSPSDLASCAELARAPAFGRCAPGAEVAWVYHDLLGPDASSSAGVVWPTAATTVDALRQLPLASVIVDTDGSRPAIERARTMLEAAYPQPYPPFTDAEWTGDSARLLNQWKQLANVVIVASLAIAGCSLAVSVAGGLSERKRPFSLLRLTGVPLAVLRRVLVLESGVPLLAAAVVATGTGFLAAHLFLRAQMDYSLRLPGIAYYALVLAGLAASVAIIASTLPLLRRITGPDTARNE